MQASFLGYQPDVKGWTRHVRSRLSAQFAHQLRQDSDSLIFPVVALYSLTALVGSWTVVHNLSESFRAINDQSLSLSGCGIDPTPLLCMPC